MKMTVSILINEEVRLREVNNLLKQTQPLVLPEFKAYLFFILSVSWEVTKAQNWPFYLLYLLQTMASWNWHWTESFWYSFFMLNVVTFSLANLGNWSSVFQLYDLHHWWVPVSWVLSSALWALLHKRRPWQRCGMKYAGSDCSGLTFDAEVLPGRLFIEQKERRHDKCKTKIKTFSDSHKWNS